MNLERFNPRAREGRDRRLLLLLFFLRMFQSTRPRGARQSSKSKNAVRLSFQSTRPRGARLRADMMGWGVKNVSIHAPARGATEGFPANTG